MLVAVGSFQQEWSSVPILFPNGFECRVLKWDHKFSWCKGITVYEKKPPQTVIHIPVYAQNYLGS